MTTEPIQLTFLFTDIEGSTRAWEADPEGMEEALAGHFGILREAVASRGGTLEAQTGDGVLASFGTSREAVGAAVRAQRALGTEPLAVRMGIHAGEAIRKTSGLHGTEVHRAARVMSVAHGGQIVASEAAWALLRDDPPEGVSFRDLGVHRLRDLARPERIHQVLHPDLPADFPPLRSLEGFPNNLPAELSSFVGRAEALRAVGEELDRSRLVTLTGAGGAGKTRLGLQVAADRIEAYPDGVWLVELGGLADPDLLSKEVISALGIPERIDREALRTLTDHLEERELLLVLDNCEHLIEAVASLAEGILRSAPGVRILATSREPLGVPGEVSWRVPSMEVPPAGADILDDPPEAVVLFAERARAADPSFSLTERNAPTVATISRRLDGLPLGIELAAARVRALSVGDIAERLEDRFSLLQAGPRTALPRQRTLEATVAWSYDLLDRDEQELFAHLGVFRGSFDLEAAEVVGGVGDVEPARVLDLLTSLVDKSLVAVTREGDEVRYRMLETIRHYARTRLAGSPDAEAVRDAHSRWALAFAARAIQEMMGPEQRRWMRSIRRTLDDIRAVLERALERGDRETGLRLLVTLDNWWVLTSVPEALHWLELLLATDHEIRPDVLAPALAVYGQLLTFRGDADAAVPTLERSLELFETIDDPRNRAYAQHNLALALWGDANPERIRHLNRRALETFEEIDDLPGVTRTVFMLGIWELKFGEVEAVPELAARLTALANRTGVPIIQAHAHELQGLADHFHDDHVGARRRFLEALAAFRRVGRVQCLTHCLQHVSLWALSEERADGAASLLATVEALREEHLGGIGPAFTRIWNEEALDRARGALDPSDFRTAFEEGVESDPERAIDLAESVLGAAT